MKTRLTIFVMVSFLLFAALLTCCTKDFPEKPFKAISITPISDNIPYQALGSGKILFQRNNNDKNQLNQSGFHVIEIDKKSTYGFKMNTGYANPNISPDGTRIACTLYLGLETWYDVCILNTDGSHGYPVFQSQGQGRYPTWTPDGAKIILWEDGTPGAVYSQSPVENATDNTVLIQFTYKKPPGWLLVPSGGFTISKDEKTIGVSGGYGTDGMFL